MKPHPLMPVVAIGALIAGGASLLLDLRRPDPPRNPLLDLPTPAERKADLKKALADLQSEHARLSAEIREREAEHLRLLLLPPLLRALEPGTDLEAPFIGIVSRDSGGTVSPCETLRGRTPSDYAGYIDHISGPGAGTWVIGRLKPAGDMTYSFRICHQLARDGSILDIDSPAAVTLDELRTRIAAKPPPR